MDNEIEKYEAGLKTKNKQKRYIPRKATGSSRQLHIVKPFQYQGLAQKSTKK